MTSLSMVEVHSPARQSDRSRRGNRHRQRLGARPRQRRGDDRRDLRPLVRLPAVFPVAGGAERAAFLLRLRHEGAEAAARRRSTSCWPWPTSGCGSAISIWRPATTSPAFRYAVLLRGIGAASSEQVEDLVDIAVSECERFYPAFQLVIWGGKPPEEAMADRDDRPDRRGLIRRRLPHDGRAGTLVLVGCGQMGSAMLRGWLAQRRGGRVSSWSSRPGRRGLAVPAPRSPGTGPRRELPDDLAPDAVVFAVKPQIIDDVVAGLSPLGAAADACFCRSPPARRSPASPAISGEAAIVRAMPNTPAAIGRAITVACANPHVTAAQRALCEALLAAIGESAWVEDEALMDAVTAVSGSGPAYVFLLIEALAAAGEQAGSAGRAGAAAGARHRGRRRRVGARSPARRPARLRENVTSPGGTTRAALDVLMAEDGLPAAARPRRRRRDARARASWRTELTRWPRDAARRGSRRRRCRQLDDRDRIIDAAMALIAQHGWRRLSLAAIAAEAGLPILQVYRVFPSKTAILCGFVPAHRRDGSGRAARRRGRRAPARPGVRSADAAISTRSQPYREALEVLRPRTAGRPADARLRRRGGCCARCAGCSKRPASRPAGIARHRRDQADRGGLSCKRSRVWLRDDSPDLAPTMAALDRRLRGIERWYGTRPRANAARRGGDPPRHDCCSAK